MTISSTGKITFKFTCSNGKETGLQNLPYQWANDVEAWLRGDISVTDLIEILSAHTGATQPAAKFLDHLVMLADTCLRAV